MAAVERAEQCQAIRLALPLAQAQQHVRVPGLAVFLLLSVAQAAACVALLHASLSFYLARPPHPRVDQTNQTSATRHDTDDARISPLPLMGLLGLSLS